VKTKRKRGGKRKTPGMLETSTKTFSNPEHLIAMAPQSDDSDFWLTQVCDTEFDDVLEAVHRWFHAKDSDRLMTEERFNILQSLVARFSTHTTIINHLSQLRLQTNATSTISYVLMDTSGEQTPNAGTESFIPGQSTISIQHSQRVPSLTAGGIQSLIALRPIQQLTVRIVEFKLKEVWTEKRTCT
jgi:hypothetical protein